MAMTDGLLSIQLVLYGFALCMSGMPLVLAITSGRNTRKNWTGWFIVFQSVLIAATMTGFAGILAENLFPYGVSKVFVFIFDIFQTCTLAFVIVLLPFFIYFILAKPWRAKQRIVFYPLGIVYFGLGLSGRIAGFREMSGFVMTVVFLSVYLYCMAVLIVNLRTIEEKHTRAVCLTVFITSLCLIPASIVAFIFPIVKGFAYPVYIMTFSIIMVAYYGTVFENERRRLENKPKMTAESLADHGVSEREFSVIKLISDGYTNKEIAAELNISVNTVNNHVANIFEKLGVRSRIDLLNLLKDSPWD